MGRMIQKTRVGYFIKFDLDENISFADLEKHIATLLDADIGESVKKNLQRYVLDYEDVSVMDLFAIAQSIELGILEENGEITERVRNLIKEYHNV